MPLWQQIDSILTSSQSRGLAVLLYFFSFRRQETHISFIKIQHSRRTGNTSTTSKGEGRFNDIGEDNILFPYFLTGALHIEVARNSPFVTKKALKLMQSCCTNNVFKLNQDLLG